MCNSLKKCLNWRAALKAIAMLKVILKVEANRLVVI